MRAFVILSSAMAVAGCGLDVTGSFDSSDAASGDGDGGAIAEGDAARDAAAPRDAPPPPPGPCATPPGACVQSIPAGWTLAAFEASRASPCPTSFTAHDVISGPTAAAGACGCACALGAAPTCAQGNVDTFFSTNSSCGSKGETLSVNGTGCTALAQPGNLSSHFSATALGPGGSCTANVTSDPSKVARTAARVCAAAQACAEDVCGGAAPSGFSACIYAAGDVPCPAAPWSNRTVVGDDFTLSCSTCQCAATATCTSPTLTFFDAQDCRNNVGGPFAVDGTCQATGVGGNWGGASYFKYDVTATNPSCSASGAKTATVALTATRTVCCR